MPVFFCTQKIAWLVGWLVKSSSCKNLKPQMWIVQTSYLCMQVRMMMVEAFFMDVVTYLVEYIMVLLLTRPACIC